MRESPISSTVNRTPALVLHQGRGLHDVAADDAQRVLVAPVAVAVSRDHLDLGSHPVGLGVDERAVHVPEHGCWGARPAAAPWCGGHVSPPARSPGSAPASARPRQRPPLAARRSRRPGRCPIRPTPKYRASRVGEVEAADRRRRGTSRCSRSAGSRSRARRRAAPRGSPSRCGRGRPDSRARGGCPVLLGDQVVVVEGLVGRVAPQLARGPAGGASRRTPRPGGRRAPWQDRGVVVVVGSRTRATASSTPMPAVTANAADVVGEPAVRAAPRSRPGERCGSPWRCSPLLAEVVQRCRARWCASRRRRPRCRRRRRFGRAEARDRRGRAAARSAMIRSSSACGVGVAARAPPRRRPGRRGSRVLAAQLPGVEERRPVDVTARARRAGASSSVCEPTERGVAAAVRRPVDRDVALRARLLERRQRPLARRVARAARADRLVVGADVGERTRSRARRMSSAATTAPSARRP